MAPVFPEIHPLSTSLTAYLPEQLPAGYAALFQRALDLHSRVRQQACSLKAFEAALSLALVHLDQPEPAPHSPPLNTAPSLSSSRRRHSEPSSIPLTSRQVHLLDLSSSLSHCLRKTTTICKQIEDFIKLWGNSIALSEATRRYGRLWDLHRLNAVGGRYLRSFEAEWGRLDMDIRTLEWECVCAGLARCRGEGGAGEEKSCGDE